MSILAFFGSGIPQGFFRWADRQVDLPPRPEELQRCILGGGGNLSGLAGGRFDDAKAALCGHQNFPLSERYGDAEALTQQLLKLPRVIEVAVFPDEHAVYCKVESKVYNEEQVKSIIAAVA
ncbi:hypothetical protein [Acidithiobacillus sp.]|uniref:hypothetical protein n=1 Tax=Acidithiobacillus sp. TaxID=1872118 RepID=UPI003D0739D6